MKEGDWMERTELKHYGVLGMKWGVRKDRKTGERKYADKAYAKASNKLRKLDSKIAKKNEKTSKALDKYNKAQYKADMARYKADSSTRGFTKKMRKASKLSMKASKAKNQYNKTILKSEKASKKAQNWYKQMEKTFSDVKLSNASKADIDLGKQYAAIILEANRKGGARTNWK